MELLMFIFVEVIPVISGDHLKVSGSSRSISASVGEDVTLNCSVNSHITPEHIDEVSWKKTDEDKDILVLLYQNNQTLSDSSNERYRDRVEFFTAEIPKGNFSLRLKSVRTEDKGVYMCQVFAGGLSANATTVLDQLGFSLSHIIVLILCISASGSALLLCCLIYCRSHDKGFLVQHCCNQIFLGSSVVLPCYVDKHVLNQSLVVEWRRTGSETLVHLYKDGESRAEAQQQDYHDRVHFFTDQIHHGNFSLRLDNLTAKDEGEYTCTVYSDQDCVYLSETNLTLTFTVEESDSLVVPLGGSVVLPCQINKRLLKKRLKVEWRRTDSETLVHLYQDGESRAEKQQQDYHDRAHFFTDQIQHGNFSLRLDNLTAEDEGRYTCTVYSEKDCVYSAITDLELWFEVKHSCRTLAPLGSSVVLPCYVDELLLMEGLEVEWRRTDSETLVHLYQDGESRAESQQQDYHDRAHFFTDQIQHGNFSLLLDNLRAEDEGRYTCTAYRNHTSVFSSETNLELRLQGKSALIQFMFLFLHNLKVKHY
uniref:Ig-like domain-containing protein n=1 Tax=Cyprinus carpio carpio TaxID=630221 RepID=A0A9J7ZU72_CYPCA